MTAVSFYKHGNFKALLFLLSCLSATALGMRFYQTHGHIFSSLMYAAVLQSLSIVVVLCSSLFPVLICVLAVFSNTSLFLILLCLLECFAFGFSAAGILSVWGSAGWLVCSLFLFSNKFVLFILLYLSIRYFTVLQKTTCVFACFLGVCFMSLLDKFVVSLFLQRLLSI